MSMFQNKTTAAALALSAVAFTACSREQDPKELTDLLLSNRDVKSAAVSLYQHWPDSAVIEGLIAAKKFDDLSTIATKALEQHAKLGEALEKFAIQIKDYPRSTEGK